MPAFDASLFTDAALQVRCLRSVSLPHLEGYRKATTCSTVSFLGVVLLTSVQLLMMARKALYLGLPVAMIECPFGV